MKLVNGYGSNDVRCRDMGSEESTRDEVLCGGNEDLSGAGENKERKTKAEGVGQPQERLIGEKCQGRKLKTGLKGGVS